MFFSLLLGSDCIRFAFFLQVHCKEESRQGKIATASGVMYMCFHVDINITSLPLFRCFFHFISIGAPFAFVIVCTANDSKLLLEYHLNEDYLQWITMLVQLLS